ncbi:MAG: hypothetical protein DCC75_02445 [Proteobacteria bacterium]|nr:MAG: hypothetical protein DCC75_02445 [Pseudomonadota bacterium]
MLVTTNKKSREPSADLQDAGFELAVFRGRDQAAQAGDLAVIGCLPEKVPDEFESHPLYLGLNTLANEHKGPVLVVLKGTSFIGEEFVGCLRKLHKALQKRGDGPLLIACPEERVRSSLEIKALTDLFKVFEHQAEAMEAIGFKGAVQDQRRAEEIEGTIRNALANWTKSLNLRGPSRGADALPANFIEVCEAEGGRMLKVNWCKIDEDSVASVAFAEALRQACREGDPLTIDLSQVRYLGADSIGYLRRARVSLGEKLTVIGVHGDAFATIAGMNMAWIITGDSPSTKAA